MPTTAWREVPGPDRWEIARMGWSTIAELQAGATVAGVLIPADIASMTGGGTAWTAVG